MKVGIVGAGAVGSACAMALILRGCVREVVLLDKVQERAKAVATDMRYGAPLSPAVDVRDGGYHDLVGAALVMITAGVNEKAGGATDRSDPAGRLKLLQSNAHIYHDIVPQVVQAAPQAVLLIVTDPPEPLAELARRLAGHDGVFSTGTFLDSLRFRVHLAHSLTVSPAFVDAQVLGEHGTSQVFVWSAARVAGTSVSALFAQRGLSAEELRQRVEHDVRYANITIIEGNDASQFGIGMVSARLAEMVLRDERAVVPVGCYSAKHGVTLSLPSVIGRRGVVEMLEPDLSKEEQVALQRSAETLRKAVQQIGP
jgi:L-lactate dehydrogenase